MKTKSRWLQRVKNDLAYEEGWNNIRRYLEKIDRLLRQAAAHIDDDILYEKMKKEIEQENVEDY